MKTIENNLHIKINGPNVIKYFPCFLLVPRLGITVSTEV